MKILEKIGEGGYGKVYRGNYKGRLVAIKKYKYTYLPGWLVRELCIWSRLDHPNIVKLISYELHKHKAYVIMELCDRSLRDIPQHTIIKMYGSIRQQLISALVYIHKLGYMHRDIKPDNILMKRSAVKLADFNFLIEQQGYMYDWVGTILYKQAKVRDISADYYSLNRTLDEVCPIHYDIEVPDHSSTHSEPPIEVDDIIVDRFAETFYGKIPDLVYNFSIKLYAKYVSMIFMPNYNARHMYIMACLLLSTKYYDYRDINNDNFFLPKFLRENRKRIEKYERIILENYVKDNIYDREFGCSRIL